MRENLQDPSVHKDHHFFINFSCEYADQQISFTHSISRYTTFLSHPMRSRTMNTHDLENSTTSSLGC